MNARGGRIRSLRETERKRQREKKWFARQAREKESTRRKQTRGDGYNEGGRPRRCGREDDRIKSMVAGIWYGKYSSRVQVPRDIGTEDVEPMEKRSCSSYADAKLTEYFVSHGSNERGHEWAESTAPRDTSVYCMHVNDTAALHSVHRSCAISSGLVLYACRLLIFSVCAANVSNERIVRRVIHGIHFCIPQLLKILIQNNKKRFSSV